MIVIRASDFSEFDFCEHKWFKKTVARGLAREESDAILMGRLAHDKIDKAFLKEIKLKKTLNEIFHCKRRIITRPDACGVMFSAEIGNIMLIGRPDELVADPTGCYVIDDKPNLIAYEGYKNQVRAYSLLIALNFEKEIGKRKIYSILRNRDTLEIFWREHFDRKTEAKIIAQMIRIALVKQGVISSTPATSKGKCRACSLKKCEYSYCK